jgi:hypothetical protein
LDSQLQAEITERVRQGAAPDDIERAVLGPRPWIGEEAGSAVWLYAWAEAEKRGRFVRRAGGV